MALTVLLHVQSCLLLKSESVSVPLVSQTISYSSLGYSKLYQAVNNKLDVVPAGAMKGRYAYNAN